MKKEQYVFNVFQNIAEGYDSANKRISLGRHMDWKRKALSRLIRELPDKPSILDIGCGTGDMLKLIHEKCPGASLTGLDFSPNMLKVAEKNCGGKWDQELVEGDALDLPFEDKTFDGACISFALRNTADYGMAISEAARVIKERGCLLVIDSFVPESRLIRPFYHFYFTCIMPLIGGGMGHRREYRWLSDSTRRFISARDLTGLMRRHGLGIRAKASFMMGACSYVIGKKKRR